MGISVVTRNYQITLPKDVRMLMNIKKGDKIIINLHRGRIILDVVKKSPVEDSFGIWKDEGEGITYVSEIRKEWKTRSEEVE